MHVNPGWECQTLWQIMKTTTIYRKISIEFKCMKWLLQKQTLTINSIKIGCDFMNILWIIFNCTVYTEHSILWWIAHSSIPSSPNTHLIFRGLYSPFIANGWQFCHIASCCWQKPGSEGLLWWPGESSYCTNTNRHAWVSVSLCAHTYTQINCRELWDWGWVLDMRNTGLRGPIVSEAVTQPCLPQITELLQIEL